ncbi:helix-turn-helix domain-containing protein [Nitrosomonas sp. Nm51]|uniref:helix-turn-helix domain-containing protein n=1 Tax=Nitrosomonas sp. Nm51 TaxID=133720 RepID=UPI003527316F
MAKTVGVNASTVSRLRQRCVEEGLEAALERRPRVREKSRVLGGDGEAHLVATTCSDPPPGQSRWTLSCWENDWSNRKSSNPFPMKPSDRF